MVCTPQNPMIYTGYFVKTSMIMLCLEIPCAVSLVQTCSPSPLTSSSQTSSQWMDVPSAYLLHVTPAPATSPGSQNPEQAALCPTHLTVQKCTGKNFVLIVNLFNLTWSLIPELVSVLSRPNTDGCNGNINPKVKLSLQLSSSSSKILER